MEAKIIFLRLIPIIILLSGVLFLLKKKKYNVILFTLFSFLLMELSPFMIDMKAYSFYMFFFTSIVYFILLHNIYSRFFNAATKIFLKIMTFSFILVSIIVFTILYKGDDFQVIYHNIAVNIILIIYPVLYLTQGLKQRNDYNALYFNISCVFISYFILEIILSVFLSFLFKTGLIWEVSIRPFRFFVIQIFYISLIYFGWKLGKIQKN